MATSKKKNGSRCGSFQIPPPNSRRKSARRRTALLLCCSLWLSSTGSRWVVPAVDAGFQQGSSLSILEARQRSGGGFRCYDGEGRDPQRRHHHQQQQQQKQHRRAKSKKKNAPAAAARYSLTTASSFADERQHSDARRRRGPFLRMQSRLFSSYYFASAVEPAEPTTSSTTTRPLELQHQQGPHLPSVPALPTIQLAAGGDKKTTALVEEPEPRQTNGVKQPPSSLQLNGKKDPARDAASSTSSSTSSSSNNQSKQEDVVVNRKRHKSMWRRRNARSAEEGIRREKTTQLSTILAKAAAESAAVAAAGRGALASTRKRYAARTIAGLIHALAEEVHDLEVDVDARDDTPLWDKHVDEVRIRFTRLGFKPLQIGGHSAADTVVEEILHTDEDDSITYRVGSRQLTEIACADEAFTRMDVDNSGALDRDEIVEALTVAAGPIVSTTSAKTGDDTADRGKELSRKSASSSSSKDENKQLAFLRRLATELVDLYDFNGDGVVDRLEYQSMVEDMAALRLAQEEKERKEEMKKLQRNAQKDKNSGNSSTGGWLASIGNFVSGVLGRKNNDEAETGGASSDFQAGAAGGIMRVNGDHYEPVDAQIVEDASELVRKSQGSITFSDLKLDLRRLVFGAIPVLKHITPGGPLVLEPFTTTITGSFSRDDIMNSFLLDLGLRRLVAQALKRRVRSLRDMMDFAVFYGRSWKIFSKSAPQVEVLELTNVEFDKNNKLIITGRVRVQSRQDHPVVETPFKLRTKLGTRLDGRTIRLVEPELALVFECPKALEKSMLEACKIFGVENPTKPKPIYSFFPIYSPFKLDDNDGFNLGEDNRIKSIYVEDNALRFELSAVLRPGRFLGNHYLAFTLPIRTFIITLDRVKEGVKAARRNKKAKKALREAALRSMGVGRVREDSDDDTIPPKLIDDLEFVRQKRPPKDRVRRNLRNNEPILPRMKKPKSFFSRFVDGYLQADEDDDNEKVTTAIRDFFGRQGQQQSSNN